MEEIIKLIKNKYNHAITLTIHSNGVVTLSEEFNTSISDPFVEFDSIDELRNHLNE